MVAGSMIYRWIRSLLFLFPAETAHHLAFGALRLLHAIPGIRQLLRAWLTPDPTVAIEAMSLRFPSPLGLAAGFDKDAVGYEALLSLGFGSVEVGTLTARPQPGNPKPRLFRLTQDRALINRMGFNNHGAESAYPRLAARRRATGIVGVNIGKTKVVSEEGAIADYQASTATLAKVADYLVVNVSSPNTPGLRALQAVSHLRPLLTAVAQTIATSCDQANRPRPPLLVKIAPDLADEDIDAVADLALELGLAGIVATNTTIRRDGLRTPEPQVTALGAGGLSGPPVHDRSLDVLRRLRARVGTRLTLISVGGLETAEQAYARIRAGASLVQIYTGFIYGGPLLPSRLARNLAELSRRDGFKRLQDAIGADA